MKAQFKLGIAQIVAGLEVIFYIWWTLLTIKEGARRLSQAFANYARKGF